MAKKSVRQEFIELAVRAGLSEADARRLMRCAVTMHRLAEAECNGDWPAPNGGKRTVSPCARCKGEWAPSTLSKAGVCQDCRMEDLVRATLKPYNVTKLEFNPMGYVAIELPHPEHPDYPFTLNVPVVSR